MANKLARVCHAMLHDFMDTLRSTGVETGRPAAFSASDQHPFTRQLDRKLAGRKG